MSRTAFWMFFSCWSLLLTGAVYGQQVIVTNDDNGGSTSKKTATVQTTSASQHSASKSTASKSSSNESIKNESFSVRPTGVEKVKPESEPVTVTRAAAATPAPARTPPIKKQPQVAAVTTKAPAPSVVVNNAAAKPSKASASMPDPRTMRLTKVEGPAPEPHDQLPLAAQESSTLRAPLETAFVKLADGFDFPVGKPDSQGYYKARGFRSHGHLGEDWDGIRGGDTDLGDPIYAIGNGIVVFARDCHMGWGNVVIIRHSYRDGLSVRNVDSLYGHLEKIMVRRGQMVSRGQEIATMGTAHGLYDAHLHLEVRKNIEIGMSRAKFARDSSNYFDPTQFINTHRHLSGGGANYRVAMNTFVQDSHIDWAATRNFKHSHYRGGTRESSTALKKAVAKKN